MEFVFQSLTEFKLDFHPSTYTLTSYLKPDATFWKVAHVREQRGGHRENNAISGVYAVRSLQA